MLVKCRPVSTIATRCIWNLRCIALLLLNTGEGCEIDLDFPLKITSRDCSGSPLKLIFQRKTHLFIIQYGHNKFFSMNVSRK